ncbi:hypothetical protein WJX73_005181 [Symbiochloris irregularis]|uniref:Transmembrane protein n=1 Tax=Symbiochloris irregularis TaxID=706552 RepID=A0AAW1P002_9CHLO
MSASEAGWSESEWVALWKQPREEMAPKTPVNQVKSSLRPRYDSAFGAEHFGQGGAKAEGSKPFHTVADTFASEDETSTGSEPRQKIEAARCRSDPLLCVDLEEPEPEEGSALRYAHQTSSVLTRQQYLQIQHREMAERRTNAEELHAPLLIRALMIGWVWVVFPGSYIRSFAMLLGDVIAAGASALWVKITGKSRRTRNRSSRNMRSAPPAYEVIPASKYLKAIADRNTRELQRIRE